MSVKLKTLSEQVVVVTGASSGIGLATAEAAAKRGAKVVLAARSEHTLNEAVTRITAVGGDALAVGCDVSDAAQVPAVTKISPNQRVSATTGTLGTVADVLQFPGAVPPFTVVGNWLSPNTRCTINGLPSISVSSVGNCFNAVGVPTGPPPCPGLRGEPCREYRAFANRPATP